MSLLPNQSIVPVLTFHSVGMQHDSWIWKHLSDTEQFFHRLMRLLTKHSYRTVTLPELYSHMQGESLCPPRSVVLAFDDGYLDNWVTVVPILRKYAMNGVIYVNPDFVDPGDQLRPTIEDGKGSSAQAIANSQIGFMNWPELKVAEEIGVLDVQSHSQTHTWYFSDPRVVDCYTPQSSPQYPWMAWNARPSRKPFYLQEDQRAFVPWGSPVFQHEKSLIVRRFHPDESAVEDVIRSVESRPSHEAFGSPAFRNRFERIVTDLCSNGEFPGRVEDREEYEARVRWELVASKETIESQLDKVVEYLCWPGGGVNEAAKKIAADVGYKSWTLPSRDQPEKRNRPVEDPQEIRRLPVIRDVHFFGHRWGRGSEMLTFLDILAHQGSSVFGAARKLYKMGVAFGVAGRK